MRAGLLRYIAIGLLAAVLTGCASGVSSQGAGYAADLDAISRKTEALPGEPGCFWLSNFEGSWTVLNDSELIVYAPFYSKPYLIKLFEPVPDLKFHERLGLEAVEHTGRICDRAMDNLVVPHWQPRRIPIVAVHALTVSEERQLLAKDHIKLPPGTKPRKGNQGTQS